MGPSRRWRNGPNDYAKALERFFAFIVNGGLDDQIAFTDFHPASELPPRGSDPIQILDPVNFENNIAERYKEQDRDLLVAAAQEALDAISTASPQTCQLPWWRTRWAFT